MKIYSFNQNSEGFALIELMVVIVIIAILAAIAIPNYINMRHKGFCSQAESDASIVAAAIADYFTVGTRSAVPLLADLHVNVANPVNITGASATGFFIEVTDRTGRCPVSYQNANPSWDGNCVYTKSVR
ncbi:MAG: prepilin-type N-terminal cleavage/methylation domain-containing protein [Desulfosalsimonadaceae bacterium]